METFDKIRQWASDRNLINGSSAAKQYGKLLEEVGELGTALMLDDEPETLDAIGDSIVVLTILAHQLGVDVEDCIDSAYNVIKDRKGKMIDGKFVKEA